MIFKQIYLKPHTRISIPRKEKKQIQTIIDMNNAWKDIYISVYDFKGTPKANTAIVNNIFLDFDPVKNNDVLSFEYCKMVARHLLNEKINHKVFYSGRGFHIFIDVDKSVKLRNPKQAIRNYVKELHKKTHTKSDRAVVGDLMRVRRCPGTVNLKTGRYCIPLSSHEIMTLTLHQIKSLATSHRKISQRLNLKKLNLKEYYEDKVNIYQPTSETKNITFCNSIPCVNEMMKDENLPYLMRGYVILYLRDMGYELDEIYDIMKKFLSDDKFHHCAYEEHQIEYLYNRTDIVFPNCYRLRDEDICVGGCCGNNLYIN